jgi:hypothetical protein
MKTLTRLIVIAMISLTIPSVRAEATPAPQAAEVNLKQALAEIITSTTKTVGQAKDFVLAQAPDVVRQLLAWKMAESLINDILSVLLWATAVFVTMKYFRYGIRNHWGMDEYIHGKPTIDHEDAIPLLIIWGVTGVVFDLTAIIGGCNIFNLEWVQIWLAPKVYLIEYASHLLGH